LTEDAIAQPSRIDVYDRVRAQASAIAHDRIDRSTEASAPALG